MMISCERMMAQICASLPFDEFQSQHISDSCRSLKAETAFPSHESANLIRRRAGTFGNAVLGQSAVDDCLPQHVHHVFPLRHECYLLSGDIMRYLTTSVKYLIR